MMRFLLPVTGKLLVVRRCLLADAEMANLLIYRLV